MLSPELQEKYNEQLKRIDQSYADTEYQIKLQKYYSYMEEANQSYSVLNSLGLFDSEHTHALIALCEEWAVLESEIKDKRHYYEGSPFFESPPMKMLAMIYEKAGDYSSSAAVCVRAIQAGYPNDGTKGGMRGRLARMIKRGKLDLTEEMKLVLQI